MKRTIILAHPQARLRAHQAINETPEGYAVVISEPNRTNAENALLHALIAEISKAKEWAGKKQDIEVWKRLLTAAWCRATNQQVELLPALDGYGVDIVYRKTSKLSKKECADLIEFVYAWGSDNGILWACQNKQEMI
jgi:hypothetical protein